LEIKKVSILVVEEEESVCKALLLLFSRMGYRVTIVCNGEEAMELFHKGSYDLVISDLTMPSMDGWTLARRIKEKSPHTPVCLMTGWGKEYVEPKIKGSSVDYVLFKPFRLHELLKVIEKILQMPNSYLQAPKLRDQD